MGCNLMLVGFTSKFYYELTFAACSVSYYCHYKYSKITISFDSDESQVIFGVICLRI